MIQLVPQPMPGIALAIPIAGAPFAPADAFALAFAGVASAAEAVAPRQAIAETGKDVPVREGGEANAAPVVHAAIVAAPPGCVQPPSVPIESPPPVRNGAAASLPGEPTPDGTVPTRSMPLAPVEEPETPAATADDDAQTDSDADERPMPPSAAVIVAPPTFTDPIIAPPPPNAIPAPPNAQPEADNPSLPREAGFVAERQSIPARSAAEPTAVSPMPDLRNRAPRATTPRTDAPPTPAIVEVVVSPRPPAAERAPLPPVAALAPVPAIMFPPVQPAAHVFAAAMFAAEPVERRVNDPVGDVPFGLAAAAPSPSAQAPVLSVQAVTPGQQPTLDLTRDDWMTAMIDHIETLRDDGGAVRETRMKLTPEALGGVEVSVRRDDAGTIQVRIAADTPQARALLADAAPKLAELAEARGVKIGGSNVDHHAGFADHGRRPAPPAPVSLRPRPPAEAAPNTIDTRLA